MSLNTSKAEQKHSNKLRKRCKPNPGNEPLEVTWCVTDAKPCILPIERDFHSLLPCHCDVMGWFWALFNMFNLMHATFIVIKWFSMCDSLGATLANSYTCDCEVNFLYAPYPPIFRLRGLSVEWLHSFSVSRPFISLNKPLIEPNLKKRGCSLSWYYYNHTVARRITPIPPSSIFCF